MTFLRHKKCAFKHIRNEVCFKRKLEINLVIYYFHVVDI